MNLVDHFEQHCGTIARGWNCDADGNKQRFQIIELAGGPHDGTATIATLGLSKHELHLGESKRHVRMELVMSYRTGQGPKNLPGVLQQIGNQCLDLARAPLRGEVFGPRGALIAGLPFVALYVAMPVCFPDSFHVFSDASGDSIVLAWLVPITETETTFVATSGWNAFEDVLVGANPDLTDLSRSSVV